MFHAIIKRAAKITALGLGLLAADQQADAGLIVSYEAAGVQASKIAGVTTETFDGYPAGTYTVPAGGQATAIGTVTGTTAVVRSADQYGGAGNTGNYFAIGNWSNSSTATLKLNAASQYFGFWWSAADAYNGVSLYSGGNLVGSLSSATALAALGSAYSGNPNTGANTGEKYAYLNITATNGTTFDTVVFNNSSLATGFESDNWSVLKSYTGGPSGTVINGGISYSGVVPEPSSLALVSIAGVAGAGIGLRGRRRANAAG